MAVVFGGQVRFHYVGEVFVVPVATALATKATLPSLRCPQGPQLRAGRKMSQKALYSAYLCKAAISLILNELVDTNENADWRDNETF